VKVWIYKGEVAATRAEREAQAAALAQAGMRNRPARRGARPGERGDRPDRDRSSEAPADAPVVAEPPRETAAADAPVVTAAAEATATTGQEG
jgi:small subunit ribosomal protein S3